MSNAPTDYILNHLINNKNNRYYLPCTINENHPSLPVLCHSRLINQYIYKLDYTNSEKHPYIWNRIHQDRPDNRHNHRTQGSTRLRNTLHTRLNPAITQNYWSPRNTRTTRNVFRARNTQHTRNPTQNYATYSDITHST